jgi:AraC-like DNA-binding protein
MSKDDRPQSTPTELVQLRATLNAIPTHTWYASPSGRLTFVNKRTADYLGLPTDHPLRVGIDTSAPWDAHISFLRPDDQVQTRDLWSTCLRTGEGGKKSFRVRSGRGSYRWFLGRVEPLRASDGTLLRWVGVSQDVGANPDIEEFKSATSASQERSTNPLDNRRLRRVLDYVDEHLAQDIAVADLASVACLSIFHFTRAFSAAMGMPPHRYISQRRLKRAKALMTTENTPIVEAASMCGFASQASFTRAFRQATGVTPAAYRRAFGSSL